VDEDDACAEIAKAYRKHRTKELSSKKLAKKMDDKTAAKFKFVVKILKSVDVRFRREK